MGDPILTEAQIASLRQLARNGDWMVYREPMIERLNADDKPLAVLPELIRQKLVDLRINAQGLTMLERINSRTVKAP